MAKTVDYYLSPASPWTYLGHGRFVAMTEAAGATVNLKVVNTRNVFAETGGLPMPQRHPARLAYRMIELRRWRDYLQVPLTLEPKFFPVDDTKGGRLIVAARQAGHDAVGLAGALLRAVWADERDIADDATLQAIVADQGLPGDLFEAAGGQAVADEIAANVKEAIERHVIGVPNYYIDGQPHWGQDRLDFVDRALKG